MAARSQILVFGINYTINFIIKSALLRYFYQNNVPSEFYPKTIHDFIAPSYFYNFVNEIG